MIGSSCFFLACLVVGLPLSLLFAGFIFVNRLLGVRLFDRNSYEFNDIKNSILNILLVTSGVIFIASAIAIDFVCVPFVALEKLFNYYCNNFGNNNTTKQDITKPVVVPEPVVAPVPKPVVAPVPKPAVEPTSKVAITINSYPKTLQWYVKEQQEKQEKNKYLEDLKKSMGQGKNKAKNKAKNKHKSIYNV